MRLSAIQLKARPGGKKQTVAHALALMDKARGSDLLLLPELWPTGYFSFSQYQTDAETLNGPLLRALRQKASSLKAFIFTGSFLERRGRKLFNTSVLIDSKGKIIACYRKIHLFGFHSEEQRLLTRGTKIAVVKTPWGKMGLSTCYDLRFPEFYRKMVDQGAEIFLVASAWPASRREAWTLFNRARAHENLAYLFSCNASGLSGGKRLCGQSMVVDPFGKVVAQAGAREELLTVEVDTKNVAVARKIFPALKDRIFK